MPYIDEIEASPAMAGARREGTRRVMAAGTISGDPVRNRAGEDLGKVEEIMLDLGSGRVAYVVVSFGGFLGIGDKLFAVPWDALELNEQEHEFLLDVDRKTLENAPGFDKNSWPDMADANWGTSLHAHYGRVPYWTAGGAVTPSVTVSEPPLIRTVGSSENFERRND